LFETKINYEGQFKINQKLKDKIEKKNVNKYPILNDDIGKNQRKKTKK
jgi:hypothetical protein